jgi:hypothetical protein
MADGAAVCVCVLFYGAGEKYLSLAKRVLNASMRQLANLNVEFRFGCNAIGESTREYLQAQASEYFHGALFFEEAQNVFKYPLMRRMFNERMITAPVTIWFDHDSYIEENIDAESWLNRIVRQLGSCKMIGSIHKGKLNESQLAWVNRQAWTTTDAEPHYLSYATGSWWALNTDVLYRYDWPPPNLQQKGGDLLLGELFKQQNLSLCHFRDGLRINVNEAGVETPQARTVV